MNRMSLPVAPRHEALPLDINCTLQGCQAGKFPFKMALLNLLLWHLLYLLAVTVHTCLKPAFTLDWSRVQPPWASLNFVVQYSENKILCSAEWNVTADHHRHMITVASHSQMNLISIFFSERENTADFIVLPWNKSELRAEALITAAQAKLDSCFFSLSFLFFFTRAIGLTAHYTLCHCMWMDGTLDGGNLLNVCVLCLQAHSSTAAWWPSRQADYPGSGGSEVCCPTQSPCFCRAWICSNLTFRLYVSVLILSWDSVVV